MKALILIVRFVAEIFAPKLVRFAVGIFPTIATSIGEYIRNLFTLLLPKFITVPAALYFDVFEILPDWFTYPSGIAVMVFIVIFAVPRYYKKLQAKMQEYKHRSYNFFNQFKLP